MADTIKLAILRCSNRDCSTEFAVPVESLPKRTRSPRAATDTWKAWLRCSNCKRVSAYSGSDVLTPAVYEKVDPEESHPELFSIRFRCGRGKCSIYVEFFAVEKDATALSKQSDEETMVKVLLAPDLLCSKGHMPVTRRRRGDFVTKRIF